MFSFLAPYKLFIGVGTMIFLVGGLFFAVHHVLERQRKLGYDQASAECKTRELNNEAVARAKIDQLNRQIKEAKDAAAIREQQIQTLSNSVVVATKRLRDTTSTIRNSLPTASIDALRKTADAALTVFGDCKEQYGEMGKNAAGHASDVQTLTQACSKLFSAPEDNKFENP